MAHSIAIMETFVYRGQDNELSEFCRYGRNALLCDVCRKDTGRDMRGNSHHCRK